MRKKKNSPKVESAAFVLSIEDIQGWILVSKDDDQDAWHIAWHEQFSSRIKALAFAQENHWPKPYRALRGRLTVR